MSEPNKTISPRDLWQKYISYPLYVRREKRNHDRKRRLLIAKFKPAYDVADFERGLLDSNFKSVGQHFLEHSVLLTYANSTVMIWVQCNLQDGRLMKVLREVNENNLTMLLIKIVAPIDYVGEARVQINQALELINGQYPLHERQGKPIPKFLDRSLLFLNTAATNLREVE